MNRILIGVAMIASAVVIALLIGGKTPTERQARIRAMGAALAVPLVGLMFGLPLAGFFTIASSPLLTDFTKGMSENAVRGLDVCTLVTCLIGGLFFGWVMWGMSSAVEVMMKEVLARGDPSAGDLARDAGDAGADEGEARSLEELLALALPDTAQGDAARALLERRRRALRRGAIAGWIAAIVIVGGGLALLLAAGGQRVAGGALAPLAAGIFVYRTASAWFLVAPRGVLVLRRFGRLDARRLALARHVGDACGGLAVPITIQDESFQGALPVGLALLRRAVAFPLALAVPMATIALVPPLREAGPAIAVVVGLGLSALSWLALDRILVRLAVHRASERSWERVVRRLLARIRAGRGFYGGTRVMAFPDARWQQAIELCLREGDAVVIDLTDVSDNVAWEIETTFRLVPPEAILLTWSIGEADAEGASLRELPATLRERLAAIVPDAAAIDRCRAWAYPREDDAIAVALHRETMPREVAMCLAARAGARGRSPA